MSHGQAISGWGFRYLDKWRAVVLNGAMPRWARCPLRQSTFLLNHAAARRCLPALVKCFRTGQDDNWYLVLDLVMYTALDDVFCSPFGAVPKGGDNNSTSAGVIHELSLPEG